MCFSMAQPCNIQNVNTLADLYAEVLGVLAKSRFSMVKRRFLQEMKELRPREAYPQVANQIISLIMGLKFFRVKVNEQFKNTGQYSEKIFKEIISMLTV